MSWVLKSLALNGLGLSALGIRGCNAKSWLYNLPLQTYPWEESNILVLFPGVIRQSGSEWLEGWMIAGTMIQVQIPLWELKTFTER